MRAAECDAEPGGLRTVDGSVAHADVGELGLRPVSTTRYLGGGWKLGNGVVEKWAFVPPLWPPFFFLVVSGFSTTITSPVPGGGIGATAGVPGLYALAGVKLQGISSGYTYCSSLTGWADKGQGLINWATGSSSKLTATTRPATGGRNSSAGG